MITEFSSFCAGVKDVPNERKKNSITSAMITFEMLATGVAMDARVRFLHFWVTHSPWKEKSLTSYANAFAIDNTVLQQGRAVEIMGKFIQDRMVELKCPEGPIRAWASASKDSSRMALWVVNRTLRAQKVSLKISEFKSAENYPHGHSEGNHPTMNNPPGRQGKIPKSKVVT